MTENERNKFLVIVTWVSGSWKTTLVNELVSDYGFVQPLQFTTRNPRWDRELDEYIFLTKEQFNKKLENWDFCENTIYWDNYYGITSHFDTNKKNIVIVEPVGKAQLDKFCKINGIKPISIFLDIDEKEMEHRLWMYRGSTVQEIEKRKKDFLYFSPDGYNYVVDWRDTSANVLRHVLTILSNNGIR